MSYDIGTGTDQDPCMAATVDEAEEIARVIGDNRPSASAYGGRFKLYFDSRWVITEDKTVVAVGRNREVGLATWTGILAGVNQ